MTMRKEYPESQALEVWTAHDCIVFSVLQHRGHYCGYARFPKRLLIEQRYGGIVTYVPVHGGITFAHESDDGSMVYGFDCGHHEDDVEGSPCLDIKWVRTECERMAIGIMEALAVERDYLLAATDADKGIVLDAYHTKLRERGIAFVLTDNFGAMINAMFGGL